jgi:hypothetical protein
MGNITIQSLLKEAMNASDTGRNYFLRYTSEQLQTIKENLESINPNELPTILDQPNLVNNPPALKQIKQALKDSIGYAIKVKENQIKELKTNFGKLMEEVSSDKNVSDELKGIIQKVHDQENRLEPSEFILLCEYFQKRIDRNLGSTIENIEKEVAFTKTMLQNLLNSESLMQDQKFVVKEDMLIKINNLDKQIKEKREAESLQADLLNSSVQSTDVLKRAFSFFQKIVGGNKEEE